MDAFFSVYQSLALPKLCHAASHGLVAEGATRQPINGTCLVLAVVPCVHCDGGLRLRLRP